MNKRKAAVRERLLSLVLAMLLVVTGIPVNGLVVNAEEATTEDVEATTEESTTAVENTDEADEVSDDVIDTEEVNGESEEEMPVAEEPADEEEEKEEKGGERYQVIAGDYADYVSIYKEVDGSMEEVADVASESFVAGDKVCVVVKEGYAWTLLVDDSELEADEELEGYVFTIGEEDLKLAEVYAIEAGDGAETLASGTISLPFTVTDSTSSLTIGYFYIDKSDKDGVGSVTYKPWNPHSSWNYSNKNYAVVKLTGQNGIKLTPAMLECKATLASIGLTLGKDAEGSYGDFFLRQGTDDSVYVIFDHAGSGYKSAKDNDALALTVDFNPLDKVNDITYTGSRYITATKSGTVTIGSHVYWNGTEDLVYTLSVSGLTLDKDYENIVVKNSSTDITKYVTIDNDTSGNITVTIPKDNITSNASDITVEVTDLYDVAYDFGLINSEYVTVKNVYMKNTTGDNLEKFVYGDTKFYADLALTDKALDGNYNSLKVVGYVYSDETKDDFTSFTISKSGIYYGNFSNTSVNATVNATGKAITFKLKAEPVKATEVSNPIVASNVVDGSNKAIDFLTLDLYKKNHTSGKYVAVDENDSLYEGDELAVVVSGCDDNFADYITVTESSASATVTKGKITLEDGSTADCVYTFTAGSSINLTATLSTDIVVFETGNYTVTDSSGEEIKSKIYVRSSSSSGEGTVVFTITPNEGKKLGSVAVDGDSSAFDYSKDSESYTLTVNYDANTKAQTVEVTAEEGYSLTIEKSANVTNVGTSIDSNKTITDVSSCLVAKDGSVTLYIELTSNTYEVFNNVVTVVPEKGDSYTVETHSYSGTGTDNIYYANLGKLTTNTTVKVSAVLRESADNYRILFSGDNFTAKVDNDGSYADGIPYSGTFNNAKDNDGNIATYDTKTVVLTAKDNYRFTSFEVSKDVVVSDDGRKATISDITTQDFYENSLTIKATTEKTVNLNITGSRFDVIVEENYDYHYGTNSEGKEYTDYIVDKNTNGGYYPVASDKDITLKVTVKDKTTSKVSSIKIGDLELEVIVEDADKGIYAASFNLDTLNVKADKDTNVVKIDVAIDLDSSKLQGITFVKDHYTVNTTSVVEDNSTKDLDITDFGDKASITKLLSTTVNKDDTVVFTVTPTKNYSISKLTYAGSIIYYPANKSLEELKDYFTVTENTTGSAVNYLTITLNNTAVSDTANYLVSGVQEEFVVSTQADALDNNTSATFTVELPEDKKATDDKTDLFTQDEIKYYVNGMVDANNGYYELLEGATAISFVFSADESLKLGLEFLDTKAAVANQDVTSNITIDKSDNTFTVAAKDLVDNKVDKVKVTCEVVTEDVTFTYNNKLVSISATGAIAEETNAEAKDENGNALGEDIYKKTFKVRQGKTITVDVQASHKDKVYYAKLTGITGVELTDDLTEEGAGFDVVATKDKGADITVNAEAIEFKLVKDGNGDEVTAEEDGTYFISYGSYYYASLKKGDTIVTLDEATMVIDGVSTNLTIASNQAKFYPEQKYAGKTATVTLKHKNKDEKLETVATFSFTIANVLTEVSVDGVVNGILTQTVDTKESYAIELPEGTSINDLDVTATGLAKIEVNKEKQTLDVTTKAVKAAKNAGTIQLKNGRNILATIQVNTEALVGVATTVPSVSYIASTTTGLKLNLSAAGVPDVALANGTLAYKVSLKSKTSISSNLLKQTEFYVPKNGDSQNVTLEVLNEDAKKDYSFTVTVQLVQIDCGTTVDYTAKATKPTVVDQSSAVTATEEFVVKQTYYTNVDELKLKEITNVIYRGQEDVAIADVDFGENTSMIDDAVVYFVDAKGNTYQDKSTKDEDNYYGYVAYNKLYVNVPKSLSTGTYTVVVEANVDNTNTTVPATASMTVKVEEGVWSLVLSNVPNTLYKASNKAASFKATAILNNNVTTGLKNKNVIWNIYKDVAEENDGYVFTEFTSKDALYGMVTVKNGTVTVNKAYAVSNNETKNTFYLVATSEQNPNKFDYEKVVLTNEALSISDSNFVLVQYDNETGKYKALKDQTTLTSDQVATDSNIYIAAVKNGVTSKSTYTADDFLPYTLTYKVSNKNLSVEPEVEKNTTGDAVYVYRLSTTTTLKNVKVTFTTMDGGKATAKKIFSVNYANMDNLVLSVNEKMVSGSYKFVGTTEDVLKVELGYKNATTGKFENFTGALNAKVSVKNGKILKSYTTYNTYFIKLTKGEAIFSVTDKVSKAVTSCTITNTAYSTTNVPTVTADKSSIVADSINKQSITYTFKKAADYKYVKVQIDYADRLKLVNKKNYSYNDFEDAIGEEYVILPIENGSFTLTFNENEREDISVPAGAYKLYFSYGNYKASEFIPATKAGSMTVKAVASGKAEYEVQTSYAMSLKDTTNVTLNAKVGKDTTVTFVKAKGTVLNGQSNAFSKLFTVKDGELILRSYADLSKLDKVNNKTVPQIVEGYASAATGAVDDLTGYVYYRVNGSKKLESAKVTVSLSNDALKSYTTSDIKMLAGSNVASKVSVLADKKEVDVVAAALKSGSFKVNTNDGVMTMTSSSSPAVGDSTASVYVVPSTSFYATKDGIANSAKTYGVEVSVNVNAVNTYSPVATLDSTNVAFDTYNGGVATYVAQIPYTSNIANKITSKSFSFVDTNDSKLKSYLTLSEEDGMLCLNMTKANMDKAVDAGYVSYGASKNIKLTVKYCNLVEENYTLNVTFPGKASFDKEGLQAIFTNIRKALWTDLDGNPNDVEAYLFPGTVDFTEALDAEENDITGDELDKKFEAAFISAVRKAVERQFALGADVAIKEVTADTDINKRIVKATVTLKGNAVNQDNTKVTTAYAAGTNHHGISGDIYTIDTTVAIPTDDVVSGYKARLTEFVTANIGGKLNSNYLGGLKVDNTITVDAIVDAANAYVLGGETALYSIKAEAVSNSTLEKAVVLATSSKDGSVNFDLVLYEKEEVVDSETVTDTIDKLSSAADLAFAFGQAFDTESKYYNVNTTSETIKTLAASVIADSDNQNVTADYAEDGAFEWVESKIGTSDETMKTGFKFTMVFKEASAYASIPVSRTVTFKFNNADVTTTITANDLVNAVKGAIGDNDKAAAYLTNDSETSKANILTAAQQALGNAPYEVMIDWTWVKAPTSEEDGSVKYIISFKALEGGDDTVAEAATALCTTAYEQTIKKADKYQTFDEAVAKITDDFLKIKFADVKDTWVVGGEIQSGAILKGIRKSVKYGYDAYGTVDVKEVETKNHMTVDYVKVANDYFTEYVDDCNYTAAAYNNDGRVSLAVILTQYEDGKVVNTQTIELNKIIDSLTQTYADAKAAMNALKSNLKSVFTAKTEYSDIEDWLEANIKSSTAKTVVSDFDSTACTCTITLTDKTTTNATPDAFTLNWN